MASHTCTNKSIRALEVSLNDMRCINSRFTYLLTSKKTPHNHYHIISQFGLLQTQVPEGQ